MPSDATHPTSTQSILKPEYIVYTMYAIGRDGLVHRRKAVIFSPLTSALTETKCKNDLLTREKTTTPYTNIFRVRSRQLCSIIQNRVMLPRYIHMYFQNNNIQIKNFHLKYLTYISRMNFPSLSEGRAHFQFRGVGWYFPFLFKFIRTFCKHTVKTPIRRCIIF